MKRKINILALASLACGFLVTSCGNDEPKPEPGPEVNTYSLTIDKDSGVKSVTITSEGNAVTDLTHIEEETELTATITLLDKYELTAVTLDGSTLAVTDGTYVFEMPSKNSTLKVTTERVYDSSVEVTNDSSKGTYTLTVNGATSDGSKIDSGDKVKVLVTPNEHFRLKTLTVNGQVVTYTDAGYEFNAISGKNTIEILYEEEFMFTYDLIGDTSAYNLGSLSVTAGEESIASGDYVYEGTTVTLTLSGATYYPSMLHGIYIYVNDSYVHADDETVVKNADNTSISYTFTTSSSDTLVSVLYNSSVLADDSGVKVSVEQNENFVVYGYEEADSYTGSYCTFAFRKASGFVLTGIEYQYEGGEFQKATSYNYVDKGTFGYINYYGAFTEDVTLKFLGEVRNVYTIEYEGLDEVEIGNNAPFTFATSGIEGTKVQVSNIYPKDDSKRIDNITVEVDGEPVEDLVFSKATAYSGASYSFTMPSGNVKITFVMAVNAKINVNENENIKSFTIKDSTSSSANEITTCAPGTVFFLYMEAKDGYSISSVSDDKGNSYTVTVTQQYDYTTWETYTVTYARITMPEDGSEITLTINTSKSYTAKGTTASNYSISISGYSDTYAVGSTVNFSGRTTSALYNFKDVYLTDENGTKLDTEVTYTNFDTSVSGSFVMPESNVIVVADVVELETTEIAITVDNQVDGVDTASLFSSFGIYNSSSSVTITSYSDNLIGNFLPGTDTSITLGLSGNYGAKASYVLSNGEEDAFDTPRINVRNGVREYSFSNKTIPEDTTGIKITVYKLTAYTVTFKDESGDNITLDDISFTIDDVENSSISGGVYEGSSIGVTVTKQAPSGYAYQVKFLDAATNEELETDYYGECTVNGNIIVVVEKIQAYKFVVNNETGFNGNVSLSTTDYGYYQDGDLIFGEKTGSVFISLYGFSEEVTIEYTITSGETIIASGSSTCQSYFTYETSSFDITGDVVVTLSLGE